MRIISNNKKAYFDYEVIDKKEAGILLEGWEVKSIKAGLVSLNGSYIKDVKGELFISSFTVKNWNSSTKKDPKQLNRDRKLLMHKSQINQLISKSKESGLTLIPLQIYENDTKLIKIQVGLVRGKKKFDKRQKLKEKDIKKRINQDRKF